MAGPLWVHAKCEPNLAVKVGETGVRYLGWAACWLLVKFSGFLPLETLWFPVCLILCCLSYLGVLSAMKLNRRQKPQSKVHRFCYAPSSLWFPPTHHTVWVSSSLSRSVYVCMSLHRKGRVQNRGSSDLSSGSTMEWIVICLWACNTPCWCLLSITAHRLSRPLFS